MLHPGTGLPPPWGPAYGRTAVDSTNRVSDDCVAQLMYVLMTCPGAVIIMTADWLHYMADVHIRSYKRCLQTMGILGMADT